MLVTVVIILITILFISIIIDSNMELQEIYILVFGLMFQTVSLFVRKKEYHFFAIISTKRNGKQLEKY